MKKTMILILVMLMCVFCACAKNNTTAETSANQAAQASNTTAASGNASAAPKLNAFGFSVYDMQYEFFQNMEKGTQEGVKSLGYSYILHDQKSNETEMVTGAKNLIDQGIKALIISPIKPDALNSVVQYAHDKKVPVVVDDIGGGDSKYDAIVVSDNAGGGKLAGEYTADKLLNAKNKQVAIIKCETTAVYANRRGEGFKQAVTSAGFKVVKELVGNSKQEEGYSCMKDILVSNPNVAAVFCENDNMALGAAEAISDAGIAEGKILVYGFDATATAREAIKAGKMAGSIAQYPGEMGKKCAMLADQLVKGKALAFDNEALREVYNPVTLITSSNLED